MRVEIKASMSAEDLLDAIMSKAYSNVEMYAFLNSDNLREFSPIKEDGSIDITVVIPSKGD